MTEIPLGANFKEHKNVLLGEVLVVKDYKYVGTQRRRSRALGHRAGLGLSAAILLAGLSFYVTQNSNVEESHAEAPPGLKTVTLVQAPDGGLEMPEAAVSPQENRSTVTVQSGDSAALPPQESRSTVTLQSDDSAPLSPQENWSTVTVRSGDNLAKIFHRQGLTPQEVHRVVTASGDEKALKKLQVGTTLSLRTSDEGALEELSYQLKPTKILRLYRDTTHKWHSEWVHPEIENRLAYGDATIEDSLFLAGKRAGLDDKTIMALADIYGWDIDFILDIRPGDRFKVLYEEHYIDGEKIGNGPVVAANFEVRGKDLPIYRYTDHEGRTDYYTADGKSVRKAFIRTPVKFTRISDKFDLNRRHPVLHKIRAHKGVDYAAPSGTEVKATGDGKIVFANEQGGYGNVIKVQHGTRYTTVYAHLKSFARHMKVGTTVKQGQVIGYVGMSGLATGPHLHYEFQVDGQHHNPLTVPLPQARPIGELRFAEFKAHIAQLESLLTQPTSVLLAAY